jgi:hypothetical protein
MNMNGYTLVKEENVFEHYTDNNNWNLLDPDLGGLFENPKETLYEKTANELPTSRDELYEILEQNELVEELQLTEFYPNEGRGYAVLFFRVNLPNQPARYYKFDIFDHECVHYSVPMERRRELRRIRPSDLERGPKGPFFMGVVLYFAGSPK